jgi:hypothetical protein
MKLDAGLGTEDGYLRSAGDAARAAEALGFAGLWASETKHDAFLPLAVAANETAEIELGTSVAIAFSRSPMEVAQTALGPPGPLGRALHPGPGHPGVGPISRSRGGSAPLSPGRRSR